MTGAPEEVYFAPRTPFVAKFFGYNLMEGRMAEPGVVEFMPDVRLSVGSEELAPGTAVHVCIRKEDIEWSDAGGLPCEIVTQIFQGSHDEVLLRCAGAFDLRAHWPPQHYRDKQCRIKINPNRCIVIGSSGSSETA